MSEWVEMTDAEIERLNVEMADPAKIATHARCLEIVDILDHEIAGIEAQIATARIEASVEPLPPARKDWLRRAATALSHRTAARARISVRSAEIRGIAIRAPAPGRQPGEGVAKQQRLQTEAEARREAKKAEAAATMLRAKELETSASWRRHFVNVVQASLPAAEFEKMLDEARTRAGLQPKAQP